MRILNCEQGSPEWAAERRPRLTATKAERLITPKKMEPGKWDTIINEMIAENMIRHMDNGVFLEPEARSWYELFADTKVRQVGLCVSDCDRLACSPDGLVGEDGGLELKCPAAKTQVGYLLNAELPSEYKAQVHFSLIVTGRQWWDFVSYAWGLPPLLIRVEPDEYTEKMREAIDPFWEQYQAAYRHIAARYRPRGLHIPF